MNINTHSFSTEYKFFATLILVLFRLGSHFTTCVKHLVWSSPVSEEVSHKIGVSLSFCVCFLKSRNLVLLSSDVAFTRYICYLTSHTLVPTIKRKSGKVDIRKYENLIDSKRNVGFYNCRYFAFTCIEWESDYLQNIDKRVFFHFTDKIL